MTDDELLTAFLATKDEELFAALHGRMREELFSLALHMVHSREDAEDVVQAVFCKLCVAKAKKIKSAKGFLKTMIKRAAIDHQRKENSGVREGMVSLDAFADGLQWKARDADGWMKRRGEFNPEPFVVSSEEAAGKRESQEEINRATDRLTSKQREAIELYYCRDLEIAHIAEILGVKAGTIRSRIQRGLAKLNKLLAPADRDKKTRPYLQPLQAVNPRTGSVVCEYPRVTDAVSAGLSSDCLYRALKRGTTYKGFTWSYAHAV